MVFNAVDSRKIRWVCFCSVSERGLDRKNPLIDCKLTWGIKVWQRFVQKRPPRILQLKVNLLINKLAYF